VKKSAKRLDKSRAPGTEAGTLLPTAETTTPARPMAEIIQPKPEVAERAETEAEEQARVLAKLKQLSGGKAGEDEAE